MNHIVLDFGILDPTIIYKIVLSDGKAIVTSRKVHNATVADVGELLRQKYRGMPILVSNAHMDVKDHLKKMGLRVVS